MSVNARAIDYNMLLSDDSDGIFIVLMACWMRHMLSMWKVIYVVTIV